MENLFDSQRVNLSECVVRRQEECAFHGDYTLPEYCPDMAMVVKCIATPRVQCRQWSSGQLMLDGQTNVRVLYLDEQRNRVHAVEFALPYSCTLRSERACDAVPVFLQLTTKYINCRLVTPRRVEVYGAVTVDAHAEDNVPQQLCQDAQKPGLYAWCETVPATSIVGTAEKLVTVSEVLEFPDTLPPAEMLLGGECTAMVKECKRLLGKVIVRGALRIHQLYTDRIDAGTTHCLDFSVPFSQVVDVSGVGEDSLCRVDALLLSDTERCGVGPDGENTQLEITAKLLLQVQVYAKQEMPLLLDAYHAQYPSVAETQEMTVCAYGGFCGETTVLPMVMALPDASLRELVDVWLQPQGGETTVENGTATVCGTLLVSLLARDADGQIQYFEKAEEYRLEYPCVCNSATAQVTVSDLNYRVVDGKLELQASLWVCLHLMQQSKRCVLAALSLKSDAPYPAQTAAALFYYAQPGERVWDIGRTCHAAPDAVRRENDITGDVVSEQRVLVIPLVGE